MGERRVAALAALVLGVLLIGVIAATTPWHPLPGRRSAPAPALDFTPAQLARERAFNSELNPPAYAGIVVGLVVVLVLGLTPLGARLLGALTRKPRRAPVGGPADRRASGSPVVLRLIGAAAVLSALVRLVGLPFEGWSETVLRRYGLSTQGWGGWLADQARSWGVTLVVWIVVLLGLWLLIRWFPRRWWMGAAVGGFLLVAVASYGYPVVVEPLFNSFTSMPAGPLRTELLDMARSDGVPVRDVLVADASRRTTELNAYVSGFGSTRRIVVYDTLLASAPPRQVELVVAHELGHAKRDDVLHGTFVGGLGVAVGVCLLYLVMTSPRLTRRAGLAAPVGAMRRMSGTPPGKSGAESARPDSAERARGRARESIDPRSVALLLAAVTVLTQASAPVQNLITRHIEARADAHALDLTRDPRTFVAMQRSLAVRNLDDLLPNRIEYALWNTHPSGPERIAMGRDWARLRHLPVPAPLAGP